MMFSNRLWKQNISAAVQRTSAAREVVPARNLVHRIMAVQSNRLVPKKHPRPTAYQGKQRPMAKILLAEDDPTMISLLKTLLKMEGFEVLALDVRADVPAVVEREKPQALFMDVHL